MSEDDSYYSNDEQYFMDLCRGNQIEQIDQFIKDLPENSEFNWGWFSNTGDNFMHMIAANNHPKLFDYLLPVLSKRCPRQQLLQILNKQNSNRSTPLHYAVITQSKQMVTKLLEAGADPQITNQYNRTPLQEAEKFQKFAIAQILAPATKPDLQALKKQIGDMKLDDNDSDQQQQELPIIQQKQQDRYQQVKWEQNKQQQAKIEQGKKQQSEQEQNKTSS